MPDLCNSDRQSHVATRFNTQMAAWESASDPLRARANYLIDGEGPAVPRRAVSSAGCAPSTVIAHPSLDRAPALKQLEPRAVGPVTFLLGPHP